MGRPAKLETHDWKQVVLRTPVQLHQALKVFAAAKGLTMNDVILRALTRYIQFEEVNSFLQGWKQAERKGHLLDPGSWQPSEK